jgi:hypothetical protein
MTDILGVAAVFAVQAGLIAICLILTMLDPSARGGRRSS